MSRRYLLIAATFGVVPEVRVTADCLAELDPDVPRTIVVVDGDERSLDALAGTGDVRTGADLGISLDEVGQWAGSYGPAGVMWGAFPHVIAAVGEPGERVLWIGGDVHVAAAPTAIWDALERTPLLAGRAAPSLGPHGNDRPDAANGLPHALQPVTAVDDRDGELVTRSLLGWAVGAPEVAAALADWPVPRTRPTHERVGTDEVAQLWFNALALNADAALVRSPGAVLSIAQLLVREATEGSAPGEVLIDGEPLSLLALHDFDADQPHLFEGAVRTARLSERPALAPVLADRAARLLAAGWTFEAPPSRWDHLDEGLPLRRPIQDLVRAALRSGALTRSPFTPEGFAEFREFARQPARSGGSIGVNRLLAQIHSKRPDLHVAYPSLDGPDGLGFLGWAWVYGRHELGIPESFLPPRPAFLDAAPAADGALAAGHVPDTPGVNLAGYFTSELGLGESARQIASALGAAGVPVTPVQGLLVPPTRQQAEFQPVGPQDAHHDVNVVVVNGDQMPSFARDVGEGFFENRPTVAVWWWEVDPFPAADWAAALEWVDEVWVGTDFIRSLVEPHLDVPVWVFPVPVSVSTLDEPLERAHFGFSDDETVFLYVWDYHSTEARKNPSGLVEAYRRAFPDPAASKTRLVLKCINHENLPAADEKVRLAAAGRDDITFIDRFLSGREKNGLLELADCYVSPHRSEGFGYTPAEAMLLGKPVVVTGYGGTTEYTDPEVARIVRWTPAKVGRGALPYPPDGTWADPDVDDLAAALRWIVEEPADVAAMAERGRKRVAEQHALERSGAAMAARLEVVRGRLREAAEAPAPDDPQPTAPAQAPAGGRTLKQTVRAVARKVLGRSGVARRARTSWWSMQDRAVASRTRELRERVESVDAKIEAALAAERARNDAELARTVEDRDAFNADVIDRFTLIDERHEGVARTTDALDQTVRDHLDRHAAPPYGMAEAGFALESVDGIGRALGASGLDATGDRYADFLAVFRGPYDRVKALVEPYGPILKGHGPLLDIGCGRGELLDVAEGAGLEARGIDLDVELVRQAVELGRDAEVGDGIEVLRDTPDGTLGSVSAIHVVEHLPVPQLEAFFVEAKRALRPGGLLVVETINPHETSAASTFWVDPTHRGPVFPEVSLALALSTGFSSAHVFAPDGSGDWERDRTESTRYALVARR